MSRSHMPIMSTSMQTQTYKNHMINIKHYLMNYIHELIEYKAYQILIGQGNDIYLFRYVIQSK